ncbi:Pkinase-domain-containing protein [Guyanagaster necrorhizus]|uniref:Pkinase-domain-containing protein n=1 Tax=Guyanagaster necrorhizus TaxID=856835 RepID=A0A9P8AQ76_9AGAR|nr:Pkinase-domain-containing protein [Guyanagaster necrorhizus MCA 3950]KAG7442582.1 Pkinase-domain-containing protein [Guyanagaster necrorhizus MCA 3950]
MDAPNFIDHDLWGSLHPRNSANLFRIDFFTLTSLIKIGRNPATNNIVLPGLRISNRHCEIRWDHKTVVVTDYSSNGTWVNGVKLGMNKLCILKDGDEIAFGTTMPQDEEDYRFIFHTHKTCLDEYDRGELYEHYELAHQIGEGSFGTVNKGMSLATGEFVAVKIIKLPKTIGKSRKTMRVNMAREVNIMSNLNHPNICALKDVFHHESDGSINMVMELVEGGDLLDAINNGLTQDEGTTRHIAWQVCDAVGYLHDCGVTHRDLKPENILLTRDTPPLVKIADFGLAKVVDHLTMLHTNCGSSAYRAPETFGKRARVEGYDYLADSWSMGVVVFTMLTGTLPTDKKAAARPTIEWSLLDESDVSSEAKDFMDCLLQVDVEARMTMRNAPHHPWMKDKVPEMCEWRAKVLGALAKSKEALYHEAYRK